MLIQFLLFFDYGVNIVQYDVDIPFDPPPVSPSQAPAPLGTWGRGQVNIDRETNSLQYQ